MEKKNGFHSGIVKKYINLLSNLLFFFNFFHIKLVRNKGLILDLFSL